MRVLMVIKPMFSYIFGLPEFHHQLLTANTVNMRNLKTSKLKHFKAFNGIWSRNTNKSKICLKSISNSYFRKKWQRQKMFLLVTKNISGNLCKYQHQDKIHLTKKLFKKKTLIPPGCNTHFNFIFLTDIRRWGYENTGHSVMIYYLFFTHHVL
jgi:hypothetical protein